MTAQKSWRKRFSSLLATGTAALLAASGLAFAPAVANAATEKELVVDITEIPNEKIEIGVTGSGFEDVPKLPGQTEPHAYLALIPVGLDLAGFGQDTDLPNVSATVLPDGTLGDFSSSFEASVDKLDPTEDYEVISWPSRSNPTEATLYARAAAEIDWAALTPDTQPAAPQLAVSPATDLDAAGDTVTVTGTGYNPNQPIYVTYCKDVPLEEVSFTFISNGCTTGAKQVTLNPTTDTQVQFEADGSFETTLDVAPRAEGEATAVYTIANHTAMTDRSQDAKATLAFAAAEQPAAEVSAVVTSASASGLKVKFDLANIDSDTGAYVSVFEAGKLDELGHDYMGVATDWITAAQFTDGAASRELTLSKDDLDRTKQYEIASWKAHTNPSEDTIYAHGPLEVSDAQWDAVFEDSEPVKIPFTDVKSGDKFYKEIAWMYTERLSTGVKQADGTVKYVPKAQVTREAMAAFLFRLNGDASYTAPKTSHFSDVKPGDKFYKEISWMYDQKISTGIKQPSGKPAYAPKSGITREAMAAFMYRLDDGQKGAAPKVSPFSDVTVGQKFYKEIAWMSTSGLSTGIKQPSGKPKYAAKNNVTREAMAAFLYRAEH